MNSHFIKNIAIENFKCFEKLHIEGMERINLIGGKNNVGKTAFLEAVELLVSSNELRDLAIGIHNLLKQRQDQACFTLDFLFTREPNSKEENELIVKISTKDKICEINLTEEDYEKQLLLNIDFNGNQDQELFSSEKFLKRDIPPIKNKKSNKNNVYFIRTLKMKEEGLAILHGKLIDLDRQDFLNNSLKFFDENIVNFEYILTEEKDVIFKVKLRDRQPLVLLSSLGEGVNRYIAILCAIWASKDGFLLIDEVENGIHYTNYKKLWQIIFQASAEANCQLFITSHSRECIETFNKVQLEDEHASGAYFEFYKNLKTDRITASKRDKEQLEYALTHQGRVRGE